MSEGAARRIDQAELEDIKRRTDLKGLIEGKANVPLRRTGTTFSGPCPFCGGSKSSSRFEVKPAQRLWVCAVCEEGGDCIQFVMKHEGVGFREAVERLGGTQILTDEARAKLAQQAAAREREDARRRERSILRAREIWDAASSLRGTMAEAYFAARGIPFTDGERAHSLRFQPKLDYYFSAPAAKPEVIHTGPALIAAIAQNDGSISGTHCTYLTDDCTAKLKLPPRDGDELKAKKIRGKAQGGAIWLSPSSPLLLIGEGIETTRTAQIVMRLRGIECTAWAGVSLGNIAGASLGKGTPHPDKENVWVPNAEPDLDHPGLMPPDWASDILLLGDGDSDPLMTKARLDCAAARFVAVGKRVWTAWAFDGKDFNDMVRAHE